MILPKIEVSSLVDSTYLKFLDKLEKSPFSGDVETSYASRIAQATDNSVYQQLPQAIVYPRSTLDIQHLCRQVSASEFASIKLSPRGGGTGTNGQSLSDGIIVDLSRYMNRLIELNLEEGWVKVECGMVKDQLNQLLAPHGLFFSPDLSTSNRATIGGMINTDASGQGSLFYGKTSDHVLALSTVLHNGERLEAAPLAASEIAKQPESLKPLYQQALESCKGKRSVIEAKFPKLNRFLTGYDLKHAYKPEDDEIDLSRLLCGSEGSLAFISEAKLNLSPIPKYRSLINISYSSFDKALRHAPALVEAKALSVETIDSLVLDLARNDQVWTTVKDFIDDGGSADMAGINIVEFASQDIEAHQQAVNALLEKLDNVPTSQGVLAYQRCDNLADIQAIYNMRKKAVGLLGNRKGKAKPVAFVEDTCVPPEKLADYIQEFRQLLDSKQLSYGMFGHVDSGVLHVRPALDLCDPSQEGLLREVSDQVVQLTAKYGGLMWGEHGKGYRSEYAPDFFGEELYNELRKIKASFDPLNRINPGKICTPYDSSDVLVSVDATKRGYYERQIPVHTRDSFNTVIDCNGNGLCFNFDKHSPMCPSFKLSGDRRFSPKGRAALMREWLLQLSKLDVEPVPHKAEGIDRWLPDRFLAPIKNRLAQNRGEQDFNHEVYQAMQTCLACKACTTACPIKVDVPSFRSRFLEMYHQRYLRPLKDYFVAYVEVYAPLMAKAPKLFNGVMQVKSVNRLAEKMIGMVDIPVLSSPTLAARQPEALATQRDLDDLAKLSDQQKAKTVLIVQDPFTSFYEAKLVDDFCILAKRLGYTPVLLPFKPNGKAQHIKGFLSQFKQTASSTAAFLNKVARLNIPMLGVEPALVLCYQDEYKEALGAEALQFKVQLVQEWLQYALANPSDELTALQEKLTRDHVDQKPQPWYLFAHCTEKSLKANAQQQWQLVFSGFGENLQSVAVGCCGMAGTYGHDQKQYQNSKLIYSQSWQVQLDNHPKDRCLATGYSCRSQVKRLSEQQLLHPLQALLEVIQ